MQDFQFTLRDYVNLFVRRWWVIALSTIACVVLALAWTSRQTPLYSSTAGIFINQGSASDIFDPVGSARYSYAERLAENEARFLRSGLVSAEAIERLGYEAYVSVTVDAGADVLEVTAESSDPSQAQEVAQAYAETYIEVRRERFANERLSTAAKLIERIDEVDQQLETAEGEERIRLELNRTELAQQYDLLNLAVSIADDTDGQAQIIDAAFRPTQPFTPQVRRTVMLGAVLGLLFGAGGVLLVESLDRSVKSRAMVESLTPGSPNLALIPSLSRSSNRSDTLVALREPSSIAAESFRTLRAALQYAAVDEPIRVLQVASAHSAAGKTTVAANLAFTLASAGQSVAVVDADLRRPTLHELFGVPQVPGLTSAIIGAVPLIDCLHQVQDSSGIGPIVVPSGPIPPGPAELLGSAAGLRMIEQIRDMVDVVIIDTPPVLAVADTMVLSQYVDASILVVDAKRSKRAEVSLAHDRLLQSGAPVVGTVLNRAKLDGVNGYGYGYQATGGGHSGGFFGRSRGAPRKGVATLSGAEIPRLEMALNSSRTPSRGADQGGAALNRAESAVRRRRAEASRSRPGTPATAAATPGGPTSAASTPATRTPATSTPATSTPATSTSATRTAATRTAAPAAVTPAPAKAAPPVAAAPEARPAAAAAPKAGPATAAAAPTVATTQAAAATAQQTLPGTATHARVAEGDPVGAVVLGSGDQVSARVESSTRTSFDATEWADDVDVRN